jgi:hypothetical protein
MVWGAPREAGTQLYFTLPVANTEGERSFCPEARLRSNMSQDKVSDLSILSIESSITRDWNCDQIIESVARDKARKRLWKVKTFLSALGPRKLLIRPWIQTKNEMGRSENTKQEWNPSTVTMCNLVWLSFYKHSSQLLTIKKKTLIHEPVNAMSYNLCD